MRSWRHLLQRWRAMGWLALGRPERALSVYDRMLSRWPDDAYALSSRCHLHAQAGRLREALADSARWVDTQALSAHAWFNHGFLLESEGRDEQALAAFVRATDLSPDLDRAWYGQGLVLIRLRRHDDAIRALQRTTELQPMGPHAWYQLARLHAARGDIDAARHVIRHLRRFEPQVGLQLERETGLVAVA